MNAGDWSKGSLIPSRRALADEFHVSVPTVQKAIADMVADGLLRVEAKRGTYVLGAPDAVSAVRAQSKRDAHVAKAINAPIIAAGLGHVALVADIRPGAEFDMSTAWPYVIINEAEHSLSQFDIPSRFYNRFNADRVLRPGGGPESSADVAASSQYLLRRVLDDKPLALIFHESISLTTDQSLIRDAVGAGLLLIACGSRSYGPECVSVTHDHENAGFQAVHHLLTNGCERIAFVSAYGGDWVEARLRGARRAIDRAGLSESCLVVAAGSRDAEDALREFESNHPHLPLGYRFAKDLLSSGLECDGVVAINDESALGYIEAAYELGLQPGQDYAIIGFDDTPQSQLAGLSTMHPPCVAIGREAGRAVARYLQGETELGSVSLKSRLVVRGSSALIR